MGYLLKTQEIADGVFFNSIADERYKTNRISVNFISRLDEKNATENAIIPFILEKCSQDYPDFTELNRKLDKLYGATVGGGVKKIGDLQIITLAISSIDDQFALDKEKMSEILSDILAGIVLRPYLPNGLFDSKIFDVEKQNLIDLIESEINEKRGYAVSRTEEIMGQGTPFGVNKLGSIKDAEKLTNETVLNAYRRIIKASRIEIMFIGCGNSEPSANVFKKAFQSVERQLSDDITSQVAKFSGDLKEKTDRFDVAQSKLVLGFKTQQNSDDVNPLRIMTALYGGTPVSKLFLNVREKMSLCYYCAARYDRIKGVVMVDSGVETDNIEKAKAEILNQLEEIKKGNISDYELASTKLSLKNSFKSIGDSTSGLEAWYLGQRIVNTQNDPEADALKLDLVTKEDVQRVAKMMSLDTIYLLTENKGDE